MCPSPPAYPAVIDACSTDEEVILFLKGRKIGDPVPSNLIADVDPFSFEPWDSPENIWYLYNSPDSQPDNGGSIIKLNKIGYWRSINVRMVTTMPTVGRKTTREFYLGQAPFGDQTGWVMHEYQAEQSAHPRMSKARGHNSLYRVFMESEHKTNSKGQDKRLSSDSTDGEYLKSRFLNLLDQNDCNSSRDESSRFELVIRDEGKTLALFNRTPQNLRTDNSVGDMHASFNFSKGDYLELKDLCSMDTSLSKEGSSSDEQKTLALSKKSPRNLPTDNPVGDMHANFDFTKGDYLELKDLYSMDTSSSKEDNSRAHNFSEEDYLELNDLYSRETSSSSSDDSSLMSVNSDDYFDPDELLRDLENASDQNVEVGRSDCSFSVSIPVKSNQVVFRLPSSDLILSNNGNLVVEESTADNYRYGKQQASSSSLPSSSVDLLQNEKAPALCTFKESRANQTVASSQGDRTTQGLGSRSASRIAKFGKKYFCFASF